MKQPKKVRRFAFWAFVVVILGFSFSSLASAQNVLINGAFHGIVTDTSGAVIPGAKVTVVNLSNGLRRVATADKAGFYTITQLPPGEYSVSVSAQGFSTVLQSSVELLTNQDLEADYTLKVGGTTQQVTVTGAPPMLQTASASLGTVVGSTEAVDLPLNGRQFTQLILLTPGAAPKESYQATYQVPVVGAARISPSVSGQQGMQDSFTIDGIWANQGFSPNSNINPPPDAIEEFNVQSHMDDAKYSISSGANVNVVTKSGGSKIHGDAWEFLRNSALDAANFFDNFANEEKPEYRQNQYGLTIGGPVMLPGYDGRKKHTYFFGYWEGYRYSQGFTEFSNVPTASELSGNFSDLLTGAQATANGQPLVDDLGRPVMVGAIYNPYSGRNVTAGQVDPVTGLTATSSGIVRDPFSGNVIPGTLVPAQALTYLQAFYPAANYGPQGNHFPNFTTVSDEDTTSDEFGAGLDHTFANNDMLSGKFYFSQPRTLQPYALLIGAQINFDPARLVSLAYTHLFSPTLIASFHFGYSYEDLGRYDLPAGLTLLNATGQAPVQEIQKAFDEVPLISLAPRLTGTQQGNVPLGPGRTHEFTADIQKVHGSHTFGVGLLYMRIHDYTNGWSTSWGFDQYPSSGIYGASTNVSSTGDGLASMLLNLPSSLSANFGLTAANLTSNWLGAYVQDKWQATKKLSFQFGLRWDIETPPHYLDNDFTMWNTNCPMGTYTSTQQIEAVEEACLLMPVSYVLQPTATNPTPLTWPTPNARTTLFDPRENGWQPRFGFAYSVRPRTVLRGAFAIFDDHSFFNMEAQDSRAGWPFGGTTALSSLNRGIISSSSITFSNPPSLAIYQPPLNTSTVVLNRATEPNGKIPYAMEYNIGVEHQITNNMTLSVNYVGSQDRDLWGDVGYNQPLPSAMGPNAIPGGEPFPFLSGVIQANYNIFPANYNGLQARLEKRFSQGLTLLTSYTYSKCLDEYSGDYVTHPQNTYDLRAEYGVCDYNFPHILSFSYAYQLPFGRGMRFASGVSRGLDTLIGSWNLGGILSAYSGAPFGVYLNFDNANAGETDRANLVAGCQLVPSGFQQDPQHWYNPACFTVPPAYTFGDAARNSLRGPDYLDWDFSLYKNFKLTESKTLQFRAEFLNLLNRVNFTPPGGTSYGSSAELGGTEGTDVSTPTFMEITSAAPAREIQFALKFLF